MRPGAGYDVKWLFLVGIVHRDSKVPAMLKESLI
jgi:hypothetical protein